MKDKDKYSIEWLRLKESEKKLFSAKYYFKKSNLYFDQLLFALKILSEQGTALRFVRDEDFDDKELDNLIPIVIEISIGGNIDHIPIARDILFKYRHNNIVKKTLPKMVLKYLDSSDDFIYRRIAELLLELNYKELKNSFINKCKKSENKDIVEIYNDFYEKYK
ncbi:MAG: hypothetical protein J6569_07590 [Gilliamella sp.]|uniref:hypothetical protein n=1 Tax=Gilliamella TaxID=1193503 RepID=UPI000A15F63D|nr:MULTISPECIES: hypothetical protein [Gilliamella]MCO6537575.1 hypothetical protein [Gilliamella sp.]MCO6539982.1 hypothetical protein [Gilliamella sp.]MCO6550633.1 hypothetical protein [Gilliamella sp.]MCO6553817.1 hypothetical protein [Gilliamella sp.]MCO6557059.1 hypothetical protein [Gilliamella sp.]